MGKPAARIGDMHVCPMVTPGLPPIPHVGGPITGPGCATVLIGGMPAAVMGDMCTCVGPPDTIILGSTGVFIGKKPAARMGDQCAHGGTIMLGCMTVLIGEVSSGGAVAGGPVAATTPQVMVEQFDTVSAEQVKSNALKMSAAYATKVSRMDALLKGAEKGSMYAHKHNEEDCKVQYVVTNQANSPMTDLKYEIQTSDGKLFKGKTDNNGFTQQISGYTEGMCSINFPE